MSWVFSSSFELETYSSNDSPYPLPDKDDEIILVNGKTLLDFLGWRDSKVSNSSPTEKVELSPSHESDVKDSNA